VAAVILGVIQARVSSTRLPGKALLPILGRPMLERQIERVRRAERLDGLVVATSIDRSDDPIADLCDSLGVSVHRGSLEDVLDRFRGAAAGASADHVVRLTGDCPLADPDVIDEVVALHLSGGFDYTSNVDPPTYPDGLDVEVLSSSALESAWCEARRVPEREHVTLWVREHRERFRMGNLTHEPDLSTLRLTVDEVADLDLVRAIFAALYPARADFGLQEIVDLLERHPELQRMNSAVERNEGLTRSLKEESLNARHLEQEEG
jgi:spore coat polysaccharide biosynthesis protein SpsF